MIFFIIRGGNHINLYKNIIKFQIYNAKLGTIEGARPLPAPLATPLPMYVLHFTKKNIIKYFLNLNKVFFILNLVRSVYLVLLIYIKL